MTDQAPELLPCPFCGSPAERFDDHDTGSMNEGGSCIQCTKCQASSAMHFEFKENLIDSWNTRPTPAERPVPQVREALERELNRLYAADIQYRIDRWTDETLKRGYASSWHYGELWSLIRPAIHASVAALTARPSDAAVAWRLDYAELVEILREQASDGDGTSEAAANAIERLYALLALPPDEPARVTLSTVGVEDIACEYSGVFGTPPRVCVNKDQCHRVGQCYYKKSPSQPAQNGRLKRSPTIAGEKE